MLGSVRVRCEQCANFFESSATEDLAFDGDPSTLVVGEQDAFLAELLRKHLVLSTQVLILR